MNSENKKIVSYVAAGLFAIAALALVNPIRERYHQNDLISVYSSIGGVVFATNYMTRSAYHRFKKARWQNESAFTTWGTPMFIPTNSIFRSAVIPGTK